MKERERVYVFVLMRTGGVREREKERKREREKERKREREKERKREREKERKDGVFVLCRAGVCANGYCESVCVCVCV